MMDRPVDRGPWQKWFAWRPVQANLYSAADDPPARVIGSRLCFLSVIERRKIGDVWEYAERDETDEEFWARNEY